MLRLEPILFPPPGFHHFHMECMDLYNLQDLAAARTMIREM